MIEDSELGRYRNIPKQNISNKLRGEDMWKKRRERERVASRRSGHCTAVRRRFFCRRMRKCAVVVGLQRDVEIRTLKALESRIKHKEKRWAAIQNEGIEEIDEINALKHSQYGKMMRILSRWYSVEPSRTWKQELMLVLCDRYHLETISSRLGMLRSSRWIGC